MWLKHSTYLLSIMDTTVLISCRDLHSCFQTCASLKLTGMMERFDVPKTWHFCSMNVINSCEMGTLQLPVSFPVRGVFAPDVLQPFGTTWCFLNAVLRLITSVNWNCYKMCLKSFIVSAIFSVLIDFKPSNCLTKVAAIRFLFL